MIPGYWAPWGLEGGIRLQFEGLGFRGYMVCLIRLSGRSLGVKVYLVRFRVLGKFRGGGWGFRG